MDLTPAKSTKRPTSKYDFVKVSVWIEDHFFVLSRFLVSRILNVTKVNPGDSTKIALELKKRLVDEDKLNVTTAELESYLFQIMEKYGYGADYISRYQMMTTFHHKRVPLIVLVLGTACVGKSTLGTQLAERLNMPNVVQTSIVYDIVQSFDPDFRRRPLWFRQQDSHEMLKQYALECQLIRRGLESDIAKCLKEGKSVIIEGHHIDPPLYLGSAAAQLKCLCQFENFKDLDTVCTHQMEPILQLNQDSLSLGGAIVVPFLLTLKENQHTAYIRSWLTSHQHDAAFAGHLNGASLQEEVSTLLHNFQLLQRYLEHFSHLMTVVPVEGDNYEHTLDIMHTTVLNRIEAAFANDSVSSP
eukprot:GILK01003510.1.p1 GENE.GILK01003510.1~~GILK01003510.1.p1  ORF type:complete len:357 (+),score=61.21 GILK01003510.1:98-1168(+)